MEKNKNQKKETSKSQIKKENQDLPNLPSSDEVVDTTQPTKSEVEKSSKLNKEGKTDNTEKH